MKTFTIKTEIEQFQEQYPELYQQIFDLGYNSCLEQKELYENSSNSDYDEWPVEFDEGMGFYDNYPEKCNPTDNSERYFKHDTWDAIYKKAQDLEFEGYKAGNKDWCKFMLSYKDTKNMYIAWNPTHKQFAVESMPEVIDELYPHLVNAILEKTDKKPINMDIYTDFSNINTLL